jgi:centrin-1
MGAPAVKKRGASSPKGSPKGEHKKKTRAKDAAPEAAEGGEVAAAAAEEEADQVGETDETPKGEGGENAKREEAETAEERAKREAEEEAKLSKKVERAKNELKDKLASSLSKVNDLFGSWDVDGHGRIDKTEFREAMKELGWYASDAICDAAFADYDFDGSGEIEYAEYVRYTLRDALARNLGRVMDLFKKWDTDHSGTIDKKEFRASIRRMGFDAPSRDLDGLFDEVDVDGSGSVDFKELNKVLRVGSMVELKPELRAGAAGTIELKPVNKSKGAAAQRRGSGDAGRKGKGKGVAPPEKGSPKSTPSAAPPAPAPAAAPVAAPAPAPAPLNRAARAVKDAALEALEAVEAVAEAAAEVVAEATEVIADVVEDGINAAERATGWDIDGDGDVGVKGSGGDHRVITANDGPTTTEKASTTAPAAVSTAARSATTAPAPPKAPSPAAARATSKSPAAAAPAASKALSPAAAPATAGARAAHGAARSGRDSTRASGGKAAALRRASTAAEEEEESAAEGAAEGAALAARAEKGHDAWGGGADAFASTPPTEATAAPPQLRWKTAAVEVGASLSMKRRTGSGMMMEDPANVPAEVKWMSALSDAQAMELAEQLVGTSATPVGRGGPVGLGPDQPTAPKGGSPLLSPHRRVRMPADEIVKGARPASGPQPATFLQFVLLDEARGEEVAAVLSGLSAGLSSAQTDAAVNAGSSGVARTAAQPYSGIRGCYAWGDMLTGGNLHIELPKGSPRPVRLLVQLWEGRKSNGRSSAGDAALGDPTAPPATPLASCVATLQPRANVQPLPPTATPASTPSATVSLPKQKQSGGGQQSESGADPDAGAGQLEVLLRGRAGLGRDYRVQLGWKIAIW